MTAAVREISVGVRRFVAVCPEHPSWRPGSKYDRSAAEWDVTSHQQSYHHDGIDYDAMPADLAALIRIINDRRHRIQLARAARAWKDAS